MRYIDLRKSIMKNTVILILTTVSLPLMANENLSAIKPMALVSLKKGSEQYSGICKAADDKCKNAKNIWQVEGLEDIFYLTTPSNELIKIRKINGIYTKIGLWEFGDKKNPNSPDDELTKEDLYIYPALYPLSKTKQAIALVSKWATSYSGGGREEEYADFIMINNDGTHKTAYKNILFSSKEMIRACFSDDDYAKKSHCHDENWSILRLKFIDDGKEYFSWKFITKSYDWPAFSDKTSISVKAHEKILDPFQPQPGSR